MKPTGVQIFPFRPEFRDYFRLLNEPWLYEYGFYDAHDKQMLENPETEIIEPGGQIFFASINEAIAGTIAVRVSGASQYELVKMAVDKEYRKMGIGMALIKSVIDFVSIKGASTIELYTESRLQAAFRLYSKAGFKKVKLPPGCKYGTRCDIRMEFILK